MQYPFNLIKAYKNYEITRAEFCRKYAAMQGFNDEVKGYATQSGTYATYRGRTAKIEGNFLVWQESNGQQHSARTFKELKIKIDILEIKAAA